MKPLRTPALTPAIVWWRTRVTLPARAACKAMLRSCAIPANFGPQPAIRTQKPLFLRQRGIPRFPSVGVERGAIARFRSGTSAFTARDADHYTTIAIVGQGGWIRSSGLRLPTPALFQLSYTLHVGCRTWNLTKDLSLIGRSLCAELYGSVETPCSRRMRRRTAASRTWPAPAKPECAVRGGFIPGGKLAPRSGLEPLSSALTVRCLACRPSRNNRNWLTRLDLNQDLTV